MVNWPGVVPGRQETVIHRYRKSPMKKFTPAALFPLLLLLLNSAPLTAHDWIGEHIQMIVMGDFEAADSVLRLREERYPRSAKVHFYRASLENARMDFYETSLEDSLLLRAANRTIALCDDSLKRALPTREQARYHFYRGSVYGFLAMHRGRAGNYFSAIADGNRARADLSRAVALDSSLYDAYLGLGSYYYWTSARLSWIPLWSDRREEGIRMVKTTVDSGRYARRMALHQLVYILLDAGRYDEALSYARRGMAETPGSPYMLWALSHVYMKKKDLPLAIKTYQMLDDALSHLRKPNAHHRVVCWARLADMQSRAGECRAALATIGQIVKDRWYQSRRDDEEIERLMEETRQRCLP